MLKHINFSETPYTVVHKTFWPEIQCLLIESKQITNILGKYHDCRNAKTSQYTAKKVLLLGKLWLTSTGFATTLESWRVIFLDFLKALFLFLLAWWSMGNDLCCLLLLASWASLVSSATGRKHKLLALHGCCSRIYMQSSFNWRNETISHKKKKTYWFWYSIEPQSHFCDYTQSAFWTNKQVCQVIPCRCLSVEKKV